MFVGIHLPFYEDFRGLDFPLLNSPSTEARSILRFFFLLFHIFKHAQRINGKN